MVVFAVAGFLFCEPKEMQSHCGLLDRKRVVSVTSGQMLLGPGSEVGPGLASKCDCFLWWHKIDLTVQLGLGLFLSRQLPKLDPSGS